MSEAASKAPESVLEMLSRPKPGRPSKLTDDTKERLFQALLAGNNLRDACIFAGIGVSTYESWMEQARQDKNAGKQTMYVKFMEQCQEVMEMAKPRLVAIVAKGAQKDPRLALSILERRYGGEWAANQCSGNVIAGPGANVQIVNMSPDFVVRLIMEALAPEPAEIKDRILNRLMSSPLMLPRSGAEEVVYHG